jgi:histidinol-phosphate aminotransferase
MTDEASKPRAPKASAPPTSHSSGGSGDGLGYVRPDIRSLVGYTPGEQQPGFVKLNTNESAYAPSPRVRQALAAFSDESLRLYPDPVSRRLREVAAARFGVRPAQIIAGNGSDDCLTIIYRTFLAPSLSPGVASDVAAASPWPSYGLYETLAGLQGTRLVRVPFERGPTDWTLPDGLAGTGARLTLIANPGNPSSTLTPVPVLRSLAERLDGMLVVDEAYVDFALGVDPEASMLPHLDAHPNLIVLRTFSKGFGLAGIRLGLMFAAEPLCAEMNKVKDSYNVNALTQAIGIAALEDRAHQDQLVRRTLDEKARLERELTVLGWTWPRAGGNFLLCDAGPRARDIYQALVERKILVRYWDTPELATSLRITVGRPDQNDALVAALRDILA